MRRALRHFELVCPFGLVPPTFLPEDFLEDPQLERRAYRDMGIAASKHSHAERETAAKPLTAHMPFIIDVEYCGA